MAYKETRKALLKELKDLGVQAPAERFPNIRPDQYVGGFEVEVAQSQQIEDMREMVTDIRNTQEWNARQ